MKKLTFFLALLLAQSLRAQTSNTMPFTAVTPIIPVITSLGGLSPQGSIYTGKKLQIIGTGFNTSCNVNIDGAVQPGSSVTFVSATEIDYTVPAAMGSSLPGTAHTASVSCSTAVLAFDVAPTVTLPNGTVGVLYTDAAGQPVNLGVLANVVGGVPPYSYSVTTGAPPAGLTLSPSGVLAGTPSGAGSFNFTYTVSDSSGTAAGKREVSTVAANAKKEITEAP